MRFVCWEDGSVRVIDRLVFVFVTVGGAFIYSREGLVDSTTT